MQGCKPSKFIDWSTYPTLTYHPNIHKGSIFGLSKGNHWFSEAITEAHHPLPWTTRKSAVPKSAAVPKGPAFLGGGKGGKRDEATARKK